MLRSAVVEMIRTASRRLPGGEMETLHAGQRYTLDGPAADALCVGTAADARIVDEFLIPETDAERAAAAAPEDGE